MQILEATPNRFQGIELDPAALPSDPEEFRTRLSKSLQEWKREAFKLVWINIPIERAALIPVATQAGFTFHHSGTDYLLLTKRLAPTGAAQRAASSSVRMSARGMGRGSNARGLQRRFIASLIG